MLQVFILYCLGRFLGCIGFDLSFVLVTERQPGLASFIECYTEGPRHPAGWKMTGTY